MRRVSQASLALSLCLTALGGCKPEKPPADDPQGSIKTAPKAAVASEAQGKIVARVGDHAITLAEFEARLNQQSPFARSRYSSLQRKKEFLDSLVRFELLALDAQKKGFDQDPDVQLAMKQAMVKKLTADEIRGLVKLADITDADVAAYYNEHLDEFDKPAEVRASQIVVADEGAARKLLAEMLPKIQAEPRRARQIFADYVRLHSTDEATKRMAGDLQFFGAPDEKRVLRTPDQPPVDAAIAAAAVALEKVGDVHTAPIQTAAGWHLVQKTGFRRPYKRELDDVKTSIRNKLFRVRKSESMEAYVQRLREGAQVVIDEAVVGEAQVKPSEGPVPDLTPPYMRGPGAPGGLPGLELPEDTEGGDPQELP